MSSSANSPCPYTLIMHEPTTSPAPPQRSFTSLLYLIVFFLFCSLGSVIFCLYLLEPDAKISSVTRPTPHKITPNPVLYELLKEDVSIRRKRLRKRYEEASTNADRDAALVDARKLLESIAPEMMRCWLGTKWDFNGMTETPGDGKIACGYFVNTILRDTGFNLPRIKLSQQPSQTILRAFVPRTSMTVMSNASYQRFSEDLLSNEPGIYIVGLDNHVGFILHQGSSFRFIHASGRPPWTVVDEPADHAQSLELSKYRVFGNITAEVDTLKKWLTNTPVYPPRP